MLATLGGLLALLLGLLLMLLPLLVSELSRPRDSVWGAIVLLLGLVLVTSADRLVGAPMLGVLCGGLLIGRLGLEVGQGRWRQLSAEERQRLGTVERWTTGLGQLAITVANLLQRVTAAVAGLGGALASLRPKPGAATAPGTERTGRHKGKRWVRPETPPSATAASGSEPAPEAASPAATGPDAPDSEGTPGAPVHTGSDQPGAGGHSPGNDRSDLDAEAAPPAAAGAPPQPGAGTDEGGADPAAAEPHPAAAAGAAQSPAHGDAVHAGDAAQHGTGRDGDTVADPDPDAPAAEARQAPGG